MVGGIAHDFNNILAGISGNIFLAKQANAGEPIAQEKLENVEKLSNRAAALINQLLTFARKDKGYMEPLAIIPFLRETLILLRSGVAENIIIKENICDDVLLIRGDTTQLHQMLMNLITNAADALDSAENPSIDVVAEPMIVDKLLVEKKPFLIEGSYLHLKVQDNGCGIELRNINHLYEPFFTTKEQGKGTGLGLAMVFGAIKTHHGYIDVESAVGKGTTFHVYLPLLQDESKTCVVSLDSQTIVDGAGETILLVDDELNIVETSKEVLESLGYQVLIASNGVEALDVYAMHQESIDLVMIDVVMPKMGGVEAVQKMQQLSPNLKVIYSTGYDKDAAMAGYRHQKEVAILTKPYDIQLLSQTIRQQLDT